MFMKGIYTMRTLILASLLAASACTPQTRLATPPPERLVCADEPQPPDLPPVDWASVETARPVQLQRDITIFDYVLAFRTALGDCKGNLAYVAAWAREVGGGQ